MTFKIGVGNRAVPFFVVLKTADGNAVDLSGSTATFTMKESTPTGTAKVNAQSVTVQPTQTFTVDTGNGTIVAYENKARDGDQIIVSNSGGALPTNLAASTRYFVRDRNSANFKVAATPGGTAISLTGAGTGTHSFYIVGSVQYAFAAADVDTAGDYGGFIDQTVTASTFVATFPPESDPNRHTGFPITIFAK